MSDSTIGYKTIPWVEVPEFTKIDSVKTEYFKKTTLQFKHNIEADTSFSESLFKNHLLAPVHSEPIKLDYYNNDWILIPFFFVFILFIYLMSNFYTRWKLTLTAMFIKRHMRKLERDGNIFKESIIFPMYFIQIITNSLLLFFIIYHFFHSEIELTAWLQFLIILLGYLFFLLTKILVLNFTAFIFDSFDEASRFIQGSLLIYSSSSFVVFPLIFIYYYSNYSALLYLSALIIVIATIYKNIYSLILWLKTYNYFKIISYLCTVEILPYVLIVKAILILINYQ